MALPFPTMRVGSIDPAGAPPAAIIPNGERYLYLGSDRWEIWTYHSARPQGRRWIKLASISVASGVTIEAISQTEFDAISAPDVSTVYVIA